MKSLFGKKSTARALAEVLEDGRARADEAMQHPKYRDYAGKEPLIDVRVRVLPVSDPPFEAVMKAGLTLTYLLMPGVRVEVTYTPGKTESVKLDDNQGAILARNPQLIRSG